jgi:hypothetical protein
MKSAKAHKMSNMLQFFITLSYIVAYIFFPYLLFTLPFEENVIKRRRYPYSNLCCLVFDAMKQSKASDQHWRPPP